MAQTNSKANTKTCLPLRIHARTCKNNLTAKEKRLAKAASKTKARELAAVKFPMHADKLKTVNSDGRAEALLMAVYIKDQQSCTT